MLIFQNQEILLLQQMGKKAISIVGSEKESLKEKVHTRQPLLKKLASIYF